MRIREPERYSINTFGRYRLVRDIVLESGQRMRVEAQRDTDGRMIALRCEEITDDAESD